eukprot:Gb_06461 [translate_table: standard]
MTFQKASDMNGNVLGISVCSPRRYEPPKCLNYLTSPHVMIWSAVTASCVCLQAYFKLIELMGNDRSGELVPYHTLFQVGLEESSGIGIRQCTDGMGNAMRFNAIRRIPSWNCMAREISWGSLDDEGLIEFASQLGGSWGGPCGQTLRFSRSTHNVSDSESENMDLDASCTRVGGPLRTSSETKFIQSFDIDGELNKQCNIDEDQVHDSSKIIKDYKFSRI